MNKSSLSESPPSKRARLVSDLSSKKACIVCYCSEVVNEFYYNIYIVDMNNKSGEMRQLSPTFRVVESDFGDLGFCVFGSNMYLFGGFHDSFAIPDYGVEPLTRSVYSIDLSSFDSTQSDKIILGKSSPSLVEVCPGRPRICPVAIPTPDPNEFLVFSQCILEESDFELFNPVKASWTKLPCLPRSSRTWVTVYAFINKSVLLIKTLKDNMFTIDLKSSGEGWKPCSIGSCGACFRSVVGGFKYVIDGILTLDPYGYHDISNDIISKSSRLGTLFRPPLSSFDQYRRQEEFGNLMKLFTLIDYDVEKGMCTHAVLQVWRYIGDDGVMQPRMILDVFDGDINKYKQDNLLKGESPAMLTIKKLVTLKFFNDSFDRFIPYYVAVF